MSGLLCYVAWASRSSAAFGIFVIMSLQPQTTPLIVQVRPKSCSQIVSLMVITLLIAVCIGCSVKAASVQSELEREYKAIQQLPEAQAKRYHASHKARQAVVGAQYQSTLSYSDIRKYYDSELSKHGWAFIREEDVLYGEILRGKNYGGKHVFYRKGEYIADLQYAGEQESQFRWTYTFSLTWGIY